MYAELRRPTLMRFGLVTILATLICTVLYSLTGSYGYLTFKHHVHSDILVNYRQNDALAISARVFIVIIVFSTFAICQFVGRYFWSKIAILSLELSCLIKFGDFLRYLITSHLQALFSFEGSMKAERTPLQVLAVTNLVKFLF